MFGKKSGDTCDYDTDCEVGNTCNDNMCQLPVPGSGQFGDECRASSDCDIHHGLCCRLTRRQKMQPKKVKIFANY